eukprot:s253_g9.t1
MKAPRGRKFPKPREVEELQQLATGCPFLRRFVGPVYTVQSDFNGAVVSSAVKPAVDRSLKGFRSSNAAATAGIRPMVYF